ncbi:MAG: DNA-binding protein [Elusimicrobiota bacterium]|jgi:predicted DNA-binding protein with PD1-like motif|nr:DNA-binding protein [Elusimicrobiota bacterium]
MNSGYQIEVYKDEDLREKISKFILKNSWKGGYISGAIGSVKDVCFAVPASNEYPPKIEFVSCPSAGELLSFSGEIIPAHLVPPPMKTIYPIDGDYFIHIHASVAVAGSHIYGGGFLRGRAFRGVNIFIHPPLIAASI